MTPHRAHPAAERVRGWARLFELVGIVLALDERAGLEERERRRLDREIGSGMTSAAPKGLELLRTWLRQAPTTALRGRIEGVRTSLSWLRGLLIVAGLFFGWATAAALLTINTHEGRINIVVAVSILVAIPLGLLVAALLGWLWSMRPFGTDTSRSLTDLLRNAGFGRLVMRFLPQSAREDVEIVIGRFTARERLYRRVERGNLLLWSQSMGLAFGLGSLAATLVFVVFTDLAFGWSTTLDVSANQVHRWVRLLAAPWASIWPDANPSLELVEATRFFRVALEDRNAHVDPLLYGGWWPFLVMSILGYAILPRALTTAALSFWVSRETGHAIGLTPGVDRLVDRLTTPIIETQALSAEGETGQSPDDLVAEVELANWVSAEAGPEPVVVRWAELSDEHGLRTILATQAVQLFEAGGRCSLEDDAAVARELSAGAAGIVFCVRGYEPPVLDVLDFLRTVREAIGRERSILVALLGASDADARTWRRKLVSLADTRLAVATAEVADA